MEYLDLQKLFETETLWNNTHAALIANHFLVYFWGKSTIVMQQLYLVIKLTPRRNRSRYSYFVIEKVFQNVGINRRVT